MAKAVKQAKDNAVTSIHAPVWTDMLCMLFNEQEIKRLANVMQVKIQGFAAKNVLKAPYTLLRRKTLEQLRKMPDLGLWLETLFKPIVEKYRAKELSFDDFCFEVQLTSEASAADAVAVAGALYPESFNEYQAKIEENIKQALHPLAGLPVKKLTFKKELQLLASTIDEPVSTDAFVRLFDTRFPGLNEQEPAFSIKTWIKEQRSVQPGELAYVTAKYKDEWEKWNEGEKAAYLAMAVQDTHRLFMKAIQDLLSEKDTADKQLEAMSKKLAQQEKRKAGNERVEDRLKAKLKEAEQQLAEKDKLLQEAQQDKASAERLRMELAERLRETAAAASAQSAAEPAPAPSSLLIDEPHVVLVTLLEPEEYAGFLEPARIVRIGAVSELREREWDASCVHFIHSEGFATREQFAADTMMQELGLTYRQIEGTPVTAIRKMICYLEGDWGHETH